MEINKIYKGDSLAVLKTFPDESVDMVLTSPPYWALRDYGVDGQLGLEPTFQEYINKICDIFDEIKRVLKKNGSCWVNMGDTYNNSQIAGNKKFGNEGFNKNRPSRERTTTPEKRKQNLKEKCLLQIPSRFALEMTDRGWILRNEIIWHKPNCMPSSIKDRFTVDFEKIFFFVKSEKYYFNQQFEPQKDSSINRTNHSFGGVPGKAYPGEKRESPYPQEWKPNPNGRNKRSIWSIQTKSFKIAHFATFPEKLCITPIKAGCPEGGIVLDPFMGSGTTAVVAQKLKRSYIGIDLNPKYIKMAENRLLQKILI